MNMITNKKVSIVFVPIGVVRGDEVQLNSVQTVKTT